MSYTKKKLYTLCSFLYSLVQLIRQHHSLSMGLLLISEVERGDWMKSDSKRGTLFNPI